MDQVHSVQFPQQNSGFIPHKEWLDRDLNGSHHKFVFPLEEIGDDIMGKHLKDFEATGKSFSCTECKEYLCYCSPTCDVIDVSIKYSFFTEGILERKRQKVNECFGLCKYDDNTWRWYPRQEIERVSVDVNAHSRCCGMCACSIWAGWCQKSHTLVDIVTRTEASTGVNDATWGRVFFREKRVSLKMTPDEAEAFFLYCHNYTYNTNYQAARIFNMEFLKNVTNSKYNISPTDWVNYYLSTTGEDKRPPIPHSTMRPGGGGIAAAAAAAPAKGGSGGAGLDQCAQCCGSCCGPCCGAG
jgi:hypothetical protein